MWSFACMFFELITGDFLFEPRSGEGYTKDDDHLAQIMELIGDFDLDWVAQGENAEEYFSGRGKLRKIKSLS